MVWFLLLFCIHGYICGKIVNRIIEDKGRTEDWFLWAFFFGVYVIIAAAELSKGWNCPVCGDMNAGHAGTCSCGYSVAGNM